MLFSAEEAILHQIDAQSLDTILLDKVNKTNSRSLFNSLKSNNGASDQKIEYRFHIHPGRIWYYSLSLASEIYSDEFSTINRIIPHLNYFDTTEAHHGIVQDKNTISFPMLGSTSPLTPTSVKKKIPDVSFECPPEYPPSYLQQVLGREERVVDNYLQDFDLNDLYYYIEHTQTPSRVYL